MNNNVYVRSNKSIKTISLVRIAFLLPLIIYGFYKNGIYLYRHHYASILGMFKPLIFIFGGALVGALINIIYEKLIKHNKDDLIECVFSSFHMEYGMILGCITSINTNLIIYFSVLAIIFFLSKFIKNRINIVSLCFLIIYLIIATTKDYTFLNNYELTKVFELDFVDYLIGRGFGGIATTHILLLFIALIGMYLTNNSKSRISISAILTYTMLAAIYALIFKNDFGYILFNNNILFLFTYVATDYGTSSYTNNGMFIYGIVLGILTFAFSFINQFVGPIIAILLVSLFNIFIDRKFGYGKR